MRHSWTANTLVIKDSVLICPSLCKDCLLFYCFSFLQSDKPQEQLRNMQIGQRPQKGSCCRIV